MPPNFVSSSKYVSVRSELICRGMICHVGSEHSVPIKI